MAMLRKVVTILLFAVVCFAILGEIEGPRTRSNGSSSRRSRGSQSQSPPESPGVTSRLRRGFSGFTNFIRSGTRGRQDGEGTSRTRSSVSRSRSRSPIRRNMSPEPTIPAGVECAPTQIYANTKDEKDIINKLVENYQRAKGDKELTAVQYANIKTSLDDKVIADHCFPLDMTLGFMRCTEALEELRSIPENFRGPCRKAFAAFCHVWPVPDSSKCSFFIKTTRGYNPPLDGYVIRIADCVRPLMSPADYQKHLDDVADSYIVSPDH